MAKSTRTSPETPDSSVSTQTNPDSPTGKGRPTPTRREREQANLRPLVAKGKEAQKAQRDRLAESRNRARIGLANGEEKYLPARDRGPQRRYVRDFVDARFSIAEALIPLMGIVFLSSIVPGVESISTILMLAFFAIAVIDLIVAGFTLRKRLAAKFGGENVERGLRLYLAMRAMQMRFMRMPKAQVKRGQYPA